MPYYTHTLRGRDTSAYTDAYNCNVRVPVGQQGLRDRAEGLRHKGQDNPDHPPLESKSETNAKWKSQAHEA